MKKSSFLTLIGAAALSCSLLSPVHAQMKIGTIDMQKVFTAYYKTHEAEDKLKDAQKAYKDELDQRMEAYKKNLDGINKLNEEINKPEQRFEGSKSAGTRFQDLRNEGPGEGDF